MNDAYFNRPRPPFEHTWTKRSLVSNDSRPSSLVIDTDLDFENYDQGNLSEDNCCQESEEQQSLYKAVNRRRASGAIRNQRSLLCNEAGSAGAPLRNDNDELSQNGRLQSHNDLTTRRSSNNPSNIYYGLDDGMTPFAITREIVLEKKEQKTKAKEEDQSYFGLQAKWIRNRLYISCIDRKSKANKTGLQIGDEIVEINDCTIDMGYPSDAVHSLLNNTSDKQLKMIIRDGFGTYINIDKNTNNLTKKNKLGICVKEGKIIAVQPGSLADHHNLQKGQGIVAVDGKIMVGKDDWYLLKKLKKKTKKKTFNISFLEGDLLEELSKAVDDD